MGSVLGHLKPELVWYHFEEICKYPRPSKKEEKIAEYVVSVGKRLGLQVEKDKFGNIVIRKPATPGLENLKTVVLQGHIDMVCEKNRDVEHDFDKDPIYPYIDGDWVKAKGTTLGADNGIGVACALAVLEAKDVEHGPLECLFTLDEETGLTGASSLKKNWLKADILINMDSEDLGTIFIGCSGGKNTAATFKAKLEKSPRNYSTFELKVAGLKGGHSGLEIHVGRGNAVKILNRAIWSYSQENNIRLAEINGGNKHNAIPREAFAVVLVPKNDEKKLKKFVAKFNDTVKAEYVSVEPDLMVSMEKHSTPEKVMDEKTQKHLLNALYSIPHGVIKMSNDIPGLVETSTNLAVVETKGKNVNIVTSQRSPVASENVDITNMVSSVLKLAGAEISYGDGYPGWAPDIHSDILKVFKSTFTKMYGKEPEVTAIHAGLECGIIKEKYPNMDMISFGPTMRDVHSPAEKLQISTVPEFYNQLKTVLKNIPAK
ncbi:MAG: aminoacyl-histidine dipeptidase [Ignavibacteriales bacterium]|nr:aminoacyl-histidine dipeptidase [Ignavibacteriales bacterium]MBP9120473.1 aminoacyl-histidine dipeptidase [Ignavibacterium sp.]